MSTIKLRRGTAAAWTSADPTLASGEPGYETDTGKTKIGDGATAWNSLAYIVTGIPQGGPLTADLNADSYRIVGLTDPALAQDAATRNYVDGAISGAGALALLYDYTVTGTDKTSIDTQVDDGGNGALALPTSYRVLEVWLYARTDEAVALSSVAYTFNNDGSSIYDKEAQSASNATVTAAPTLAAASLTRPVAGASCAANIFGTHRISIPNYGGTVGYKVGELTGGVVDTTAANTQAATMTIGYRSTTAISRLAVTPVTAGKKLKIGSRLTIFGR